MVLSFPWHTLLEVDADDPCVALLGVVHLRSVTLLPTFARFGVVIERQLRGAPGIVGYRTGADITGLGFYHLSAWKNRDAIQEFVHTAPHSKAVDQLTGRLGIIEFRYWTIRGSELPMHFVREMHRLR